MTDNMTATPEQKTELIIDALGIAGFTENPDFPGIYTQNYGAKKIVVDMTAGTSVYFMENKQKVVTDDEHDTLAKVSKMITEAEDGQMPSRGKDPDMVVTTTTSQTFSNHDGASTTSEYKEYGDTQSTHTAPENVPAVPEVPQALTPTGNTLLDLLQQYVGDDVMQVFGDTGTGKSKFALEVAREAIAAGKSVYYLDTERNLTTKDIDSLKGCDYKYTPVLDEIDKIVQKLPAVDVVILDSIGFPVLTSYARLSMKQKGDALLKLIAIFGDLKIWAYRNNGVAVVTNQPESEFNKEKGHIFRPFGDKSQFACKEIWKTEFEHRSPNETRVSIKSFRSRSMGQRSKIASLKITDARVEVIT